MPSPAGRLLPPLVRLLGYKRMFASARATLGKADDLLVRPAPYGPPRRLGHDVRITVSHDTGWPGYQVEPRRGTPTRHAVYVHGGAWINQIHPLTGVSSQRSPPAAAPASPSRSTPWCRWAPPAPSCPSSPTSSTRWPTGTAPTT